MDQGAIKIYLKHKKKYADEKVYGEPLLRWLYQSKSGLLASQLLCKAPISRLYGRYQDSKLSRYKIKNFIKNFDIPMGEYENRDFESFNDFFIRKFREGQRPFVQDKKLPAFAEGRYLAVNSIKEGQKYPIKGQHLSAKELLKNTKWEKTFDRGPLIISRLCPVDYHRFHFPDDGKVLDSYKISGPLHSVNPFALEVYPDILATNERHVTILETQNFGKLAYIEVGAIFVGKIVQTYKNETFNRGDEKGYFLFGGSTVVLLGERNTWKINDEICYHTDKGIETFLRLGEELAAL